MSKKNSDLKNAENFHTKNTTIVLLPLINFKKNSNTTAVNPKARIKSMTEILEGQWPMAPHGGLKRQPCIILNLKIPSRWDIAVHPLSLPFFEIGNNIFFSLSLFLKKRFRTKDFLISKVFVPLLYLIEANGRKTRLTFSPPRLINWKYFDPPKQSAGSWFELNIYVRRVKENLGLDSRYRSIWMGEEVLLVTISLHLKRVPFLQDVIVFPSIHCFGCFL